MTPSAPSAVRKQASRRSVRVSLPESFEREGLAIYRNTATAVQNDDAEEPRAGASIAPMRGFGPVRLLLLALTPPALAAVLAAGGLPSLRICLVAVAAVAAGAPAVWTLHGALDRGLARSATKGARGRTRAARAGPGRRGGRPWPLAAPRHGRQGVRVSPPALACIVSLAVLSAALAFTLSPLCLALYAAAVAAGAVARLLRAVTPWATVAAGATVGLGALAGWAAVAPFAPRALTIFAFFALWAIGGCDIAHGLANVDADRFGGASTVATVRGPLAAARAACVLSFAALVATIALPMTAGMVNNLALAVGVVIVALPGAQLWHRPTSAEAVAFLGRVSLYPAAVLLVALLPAMLRGL